MDDAKAKAPTPPRKRRRLWKVFGALGLLTIGLVWALPWMLGTPPARGWLVDQINAQLAPGSVELDGLGGSWTGPMELSGVALRDPKGKLVLGARRVILDRGILGLLADRSDLGTITIEGATVDVERRADGSVDVLEALASILKSDPVPPPAAGPVPAPAPPSSLPTVSVVLKGGTLRVVSPELVEPIAAGTLDGTVSIAPNKPIELAATLGDEGRSLEIRARLDPNTVADPPGDRSLTVVGKSWPIHVRQGGVEARGRFDGTLGASQAGGLWTLKGDAALLAVEATGAALLGDRLTLDRVAAACDAHQSPTGWSVGKFELTSPVASLKAEGTVPAFEGTPAQLRGRVDLAALAKMLPHAMRLRDGLAIDQGAVNLAVDLSTQGGIERAALTASLDDFAAIEAGKRVALREPVRLSGAAGRAGQKVTVEALDVKAAGIDLQGSGDLESGARVSGSVDLAVLMAQLRDVLDLGAFDLSGHARVAGDYRRQADAFKARLAADCKDLRVAGLTAEPIVRDKFRLDASTAGLTRPDGTPADWREARLDLTAGDVKLDLIATDRDGAIALAAGAGMDVTSPVVGRAEARAAFRRDGSVCEIEELRATLTPADPKAAAGAVATAFKGRLDLATGEGSFEPIPGLPVESIGLGADGAKLTGLGKADVPLRIDAALIGDLAALDRLLAAWSGSALKGLGGAWSGRLAVVRSVDAKMDVDGKIDVPNILAPGLSGPVSLAVKAGYSPKLDRLDLATADLSTGLGRVVLVGSLGEMSARKLMDLTATVEPNWATVDPLVAKSVEENARVRANVRPIHLVGALQADTMAQRLNQIAGEVGLDLTMAEAFGVNLKPTPVVLKLGGGKAVFDPIVTAMNDGPVLIQAHLRLDDLGGVWLQLDPCRIEKAGINEAVSNSVLAYVAPVLAKSTKVTGKVTVALNGGSVPITAAGALALDGAVAFQDVICDPGPLGSEVATITGRSSATIRLDQTMIVNVADGRVRQTGLSIPIGGGTTVAIDGTVGFDETLDLRATIPLTARLLGIDPKIAKVPPGRSIVVPVGGTFARPAVDRQSLRVAFREAAKSMAGKELEAEANRLLDRIAGPNPPDGEPKTRPARKNPLGDLESLGREILDQKRP